MSVLSPQLSGTSSYLNVTKNVELILDFEISILIKLQGSGGTIFTFEDGTSVYYQSNPSPNIAYRVRDSSDIYVYGGNIYYEEDTLVLVTFKRVGNTFSLSLDEGQSSQRTITAKNSYSLTTIGFSSPFQTFGSFLDLKVWESGTKDTGNLVIDSPLVFTENDLQGRSFFPNLVSNGDWTYRNISTDNEKGFLTRVEEFSGDFEWEFVFKLDTVQSFHLCADSTSNHRLFLAPSEGAIKFQHTDVVFSVPVFQVDTLYTLRVKRVGTLYLLQLNGVDYIGDSQDSVVRKFDSLLMKWSLATGVGYFSGTLFSCSFWNNGNRFTGDLLSSFEFKNQRSYFVENKVEPLGYNLWLEESVSEIGESQVLGNGNYRVFSPDGNYSSVRISSSSFLDKDFVVEFDLINGDVNDLLFQEDAGQFTKIENVLDEDGNIVQGRYKSLVRSSYSFFQIKRNNTGQPVDVTIGNVTLKEAKSYLYNNGIEGVDYEWENLNHSLVGYNLTSSLIEVLTPTEPTIVLDGLSSIQIPLGDPYTEVGYSATDIIDGDLTSSVTTTNNIDNTVAGTYTILYEVTNSNGLDAVAVRTVKVVDTHDNSLISNFKKIQTELIKSIKEVVGEHLAQIPTRVNGIATTMPAVIKGYKDGNQPPYPFVVVCKDTVTSVGKAKLLGNSYNEELGRQVTLIQQEVFMEVKCYGEDSLEILNDYLIKMNSGSTRYNLEKETCASIMDITAPVYEPTFLSTTYLDGSVMRVRFSVIYDFYPDASDGTYIDGVGIDGEVLYDHEGNPLPINLEI